MTIARAHLVDLAVSRRYHCITRCVRRAFLLGEGTTDRKVWIESRLQELGEIFAVSVGGFSVMDNHLHVLVRLDRTRRGERFSRGGSRVLRSSMKRRCWRPAPTST